MDAEVEYREFASARAAQLFRLAFLMCGDWHQAEDLVQTTLASLFVAWNRVRRSNSMEAYARRALVNAFLSHRRLRRNSETPIAQFADVSAPAVDEDLRLTLVAALRQLPPRSRAVVVLRYLEDHNIDSVAELMGVTPAAVKSLNTRGLAQLRELLSGDEQHLLQPCPRKGIDMITEDVLADLFERAVQDLNPSVHAIVTSAEQSGRQQRARRRAWLASGGAFVAALTATAVVAGLPLAHPRGAPAAAGSTSRHADTGNAGTGQVSATPPVPDSSPTTSGPGSSVLPQLAPGYQMPVADMLAVLRSLLPAGSTLGYVNPYSQPGTLEVDYNDGQGAVDFWISLGPTATFSTLNCPTPLWQDEGPRPPGALPISCAMRTLPDGSVERDAVYYADAYGFYGYSVYVGRSGRDHR